MHFVVNALQHRARELVVDGLGGIIGWARGMRIGIRPFPTHAGLPQPIQKENRILMWGETSKIMTGKHMCFDAKGANSVDAAETMASSSCGQKTKNAGNEQ